MGLAAAGAGISGYLTVAALQGTPPVCLAGACEEVAASPYARFLGLPIAAWGLGLYVVVAAVAAAGARAPAGVPAVLLGLVAFGTTFSLYLLWVQIAVLRAICAWCVASEVLWVALAAVAVLLLRAPR
ncbi:MAG: vitamin K epoxide reductase family protein [Armatimonadota bacterium]|nr:vitamin K epoxide reductase family protein [Armatimonadota bacterium]MDR7519052.1 vitamin K epoxide reductase family protein [Armatimonadota bacterium]MDR7549992.1 vitamin K epoxide reductase family protein [Armatimonadota bacterium]